jgi:transmembrane sensor
MTLPNMMLDDHDWQRLARYVAGETSGDERESTRAWLESDAARRELHARMKEAWDVARVDESRWDSRRSWDRMRARLESREIPSLRTDAARPHIAHYRAFAPASERSWWRGLGAIAAGAVVVIGGVAVAKAVTERRAAQLAQAPAIVPQMNEIFTRRAQRATVHLSDGSKITLNVDSRLRYPQEYGQASRDIYLEGEAFFEVAHRTAPFVVHTTQGSVRDIGTRFVVSAYPNSSDTKVVVSDGAVVISPRGTTGPRDSGPHPTSVPATDSLILTSSTLGIINGGKLQMSGGVGVADHLAWMDGRLVFVGAPLDDVVQRLSRWYDIDVRLGDKSLAQVQFSGTFRSENPDNVLSLLSASAGARLTRSGSAYVLTAR